MAYPPVIPPATRANATPQLDTHPADHNALVTALAAMPWGRVASVVQAGAAQNGIGSALVDVTGATLSFTRIAGRVYHVFYNLTWQQVTANSTANTLLTDNANVVLSNPGCAVIANMYMTLTHMFVLAPGAGLLTLKLRAATAAGTMNILNGPANPTSLVVYDVGPT